VEISKGTVAVVAVLKSAAAVAAGEDTELESTVLELDTMLDEEASTAAAADCAVVEELLTTELLGDARVNIVEAGGATAATADEFAAMLKAGAAMGKDPMGQEHTQAVQTPLLAAADGAAAATAATVVVEAAVVKSMTTSLNDDIEEDVPAGGGEEGAEDAATAAAGLFVAAHVETVNVVGTVNVIITVDIT